MPSPAPPTCSPSTRSASPTSRTSAPRASVLSLEEMGRLIGYRLRPGVAAETWLAFTLETPPVPPAGTKPEPGMFVTGRAGARSRSTPVSPCAACPAPDEKPQVFETVEAIDGAPRLERDAAVDERSRRTRCVARSSTYLPGVNTGLRAGRRARCSSATSILPEPRRNQWDFRILDRVVPDRAQDRTFVSWRRPLGSLDAAACTRGAAAGVRAAPACVGLRPQCAGLGAP